MPFFFHFLSFSLWMRVCTCVYLCVRERMKSVVCADLFTRVTHFPFLVTHKTAASYFSISLYSFLFSLFSILFACYYLPPSFSPASQNHSLSFSLFFVIPSLSLSLSFSHFSFSLISNFSFEHTTILVSSPAKQKYIYKIGIKQTKFSYFIFTKIFTIHTWFWALWQNEKLLACSSVEKQAPPLKQTFPKSGNKLTSLIQRATLRKQARTLNSNSLAV